LLAPAEKAILHCIGGHGRQLGDFFDRIFEDMSQDDRAPLRGWQLVEILLHHQRIVAHGAYGAIRLFVDVGATRPTLSLRKSKGCSCNDPVSPSFERALAAILPRTPEDLDETGLAGVARVGAATEKRRREALRPPEQAPDGRSLCRRIALADASHELYVRIGQHE